MLNSSNTHGAAREDAGRIDYQLSVGSASTQRILPERLADSNAQGGIAASCRDDRTLRHSGVYRRSHPALRVRYINCAIHVRYDAENQSLTGSRLQNHALTTISGGQRYAAKSGRNRGR